jgi:hypothetical protein
MHARLADRIWAALGEHTVVVVHTHASRTRRAPNPLTNPTGTPRRGLFHRISTFWGYPA